MSHSALNLASLSYQHFIGIAALSVRGSALDYMAISWSSNEHGMKITAWAISAIHSRKIYQLKIRPKLLL